MPSKTIFGILDFRCQLRGGRSSRKSDSLCYVPILSPIYQWRFQYLQEKYYLLKARTIVYFLLSALSNHISNRTSRIIIILVKLRE